MAGNLLPEGDLEMRYDVTEEQVKSYFEENDGLTALEILGIEEERFMENGIKMSNGNIKQFEDYHTYLHRQFLDGYLFFEL
jgi:hypothetical protein